MVGAIDNLPKDIIKEDLSVEACVLRCVLGNGMFKFDGASAGALLLYCQYAGARDGSVANHLALSATCWPLATGQYAGARDGSG